MLKLRVSYQSLKHCVSYYTYSTSPFGSTPKPISRAIVWQFIIVVLYYGNRQRILLSWSINQGESFIILCGHIIVAAPSEPHVGTDASDECKPSPQSSCRSTLPVSNCSAIGFASPTSQIPTAAETFYT